jgi:hypothetical protein
MRRLLQIGTMLLLLVSFAVPLAEYFDRWDPAGVADDTEFAVFAFVLAVCLILLVCQLVALALLLMRFVWLRHLVRASDSVVDAGRRVVACFVPPLCSPPLRI